MKHSLTGHMYRGSAIETDSSCGNCDGGKCESCVVVWTVGNDHYYSLSEAQEAQAALANILIRPDNDLVTDEKWEHETKWIEDKLDMAYLTPACDLVISVTFYLDEYVNGKKYIEVECLVNPSHSEFQSLYDRAVRNIKRYMACLCTDKDEDNGDGCCCRTHGCTDYRCFVEMEAGRRREKKWYM